MAKGTKRKIEIMKRDTKQQRSVACSKRRQTVFSKAADLCRHSGANIAVFVTSPSDNSDVVYSFSGYSSASEIAHCYLNGKLPPKLGFWWQDPHLYGSCDDLSELNIIHDRLLKAKKDLLACLEKKQKSQSVSTFDHNSSCSQIVSDFDQNPNSEESSDLSHFVSDLESSLHGLPSPHAVSFDQNPNSSLYVKSFDQISAKSLGKIYGESLSSQVATFVPNPISKTNEEEDDYMVNIEQLFSEEEMGLLGFCEFID